MVRFTEPLGRDYGVRAICGKGGLPDEAIEPMKKHGMVYFAIVGGAAALETTQIEEIEEVAWEELMPECLWKFRVKDFGPLTVGIDAHGASLFHDVQEAAKKRLEDLYARL
jgi:L(+)-tartrate dehydratase beta subunit